MATPATIGLRRWGIQDPYPLAFDLTPSDTVNLRTGVTEALFIGSGGIVVAVLQNGDTCAFTCVTGQTLPLRVKRVNATGTTATLLRALYYELPGEVSFAAAVTAPSYASLVVTDGASHYWRLADPSGTTAIDQVAGLNGTISGGVTLNQPGAVVGNAAMAMDGTGRIVTASTTVVPPLTIEGWLKTTVAGEKSYFGMVANGAHFIGCAKDGFDRLDLRVGFNDATSSFLNAVPGVSLIDGQWHQVVWVFGGGTAIAAYCDGAALTPSAQLLKALPAVTSTVRIPEQGLIYGQAWNGSLDEVALYPVALTATQIAAHYAARNTS